jgi:hypothetical protein
MPASDVLSSAVPADGRQDTYMRWQPSAWAALCHRCAAAELEARRICGTVDLGVTLGSSGPDHSAS